MKLLSLRAYSRHRGVTLRAVQKAIESGRIHTVQDEKGRARIDPEDADKKWDTLADPAKKRDQVAVDDPPPEELVEVAENEDIPDYPPDDSTDAEPEGDIEEREEKTPDYYNARAKREVFQARLAKLKYLERSGELVEVVKVRSEIFDLTRKTRDAILNVPNRIAAELASETDPIKVHSKLTEALVRALEDLVNAGRR